MSTKTLAKSIFTPSLLDDIIKPWNEWFDENRLFNRVASVPGVNVTENSNQYDVALAAPGLKKEDFKINVEGNRLTISAEKEDTKSENEGTFTRKEYSYSSFSRSFSLPEDVKQEGINATYTDGVLTVTLPRKEEARKTVITNRIPVK